MLSISDLVSAFEFAEIPVPDMASLEDMLSELNTTIDNSSPCVISNRYAIGITDLFDEVSAALERSMKRELRHQDCPECHGCGYVSQEPRQQCPSCLGFGVKRKFRGLLEF